MKLILLLVAIYSLIFYQQYKIKKYRNPVQNIKETIKTERTRRFADPVQPELNSSVLMRSYFMMYRYPHAPDPGNRRFIY